MNTIPTNTEQAEDTQDIASTINRETARIRWNELETHFAAGHLMSVANELDLILVAKAMAEDNAEQIKHWMQTKQLMPTSDPQAILWQQDNTELWAVVIKPWVLVQSA